MPRTARKLIDGGTYHVLTRGNNAQPIFLQDNDCQQYMRFLAASLAEHRLKLYHFVLMPNHVHLVLCTSVGKALSKAMAGLNLRYAWYYRKRHGYSGHLWQGRFKSLHIDKESYLLEVGRYVELNPVRANLVKEPAAYAWSSFRTYADGIDNSLLKPNPLYELLGRTTEERRARYRTFVLDGTRNEQLRSYVWAKPQPQSARAQVHRIASDKTKRHRDPYGLSALTRPRRCYTRHVHRDPSEPPVILRSVPK